MLLPDPDEPTIPQNVIVVGAGSAGGRAAHLLTRSLDTTKFNLIIINPRPETILYPATARVVSANRDNIKDKVFIPIENILKGKGRFIQGKVTRVEPGNYGGGTVVISNGEAIPFRALILSPGVLWDNPFGFPEGSDEVDGYLNVQRQAFEKASDIVLVGAGAVGCELAGELRDIFPDKKITLVHGSSLPLNDFYPTKFRTAVRRSWQKRNIDFIFDDFIDTIPNLSEKITETITRNGKTMKADLVVSTRGQKPNTELIAESFGKGTLTPQKLVKVDPTLQLPGYQDIFVIGDVIDWKEQKQAYKAQAHADIAVANVISLLEGRGKYKKYSGTMEFLFLSNGRNGGVTYLHMLGGITLGNWVTRQGKSKELTIPQLRSHIGV